MDKQQKTILIAVALLLAVALVALAVIFLNDKKFTPPPFDATAQKGIPTVTDASLRYGTVAISPELTVGLCGNVVYKDGSAKVYFTSFEANTVWTRAKVLDEKGNLLGESGLLRPGEYVESISLSSPVENSAKVVLKIYSYEPDTYYSMGTAEITVGFTALQ
jgi:hypothetical protein